jgi:flagellar biosynthesis chaperone FliJ
VGAAASAVPEAGTAAEFGASEAFKIAGDRIVEEARASFEAACRDCAGLEVLERRETARRRLCRSRSEARETDERNRMLATLRP